MKSHSALTHGGLFEGYGGTSMAAEMVLGPLDTRLVSDIKPAARTLLDLRKPDAPNFGDITRAFPVDPTTGEHLPIPGDVLELLATAGPIDITTISWPCQPHSSAGKRLGEADPRALWPNAARFIAATRPKIVLGENVARITSNGELRRVVRSLAELGYVGAWRVQRASDHPVYGCHQRARCFVAAVDAAAYTGGIELRNQPGRRSGTDRGGAGVAGHDGATGPVHLTLLPTPTQSMTTGAGTSGREGGLNLQTAALTLLPTPSASSYGTNQGGSAGRVGPVRESLDTMARNERLISWGAYAEAIARWGAEFGREAPAPTQPGRNGKPQLAPGFVEWMMGLPQGHVCDVPDLTRNQKLSLLGDGVVPQQGAAAFRFLLDHLAQRWAVGAA